MFGLENKLVQYERSLKIYDNITGFVERNRDIYNPTEQALDFLQKEA